MTRLRGIAETALASNDPATLRDAVGECLEESDRVVAMLNTVMDISEAETGTMSLHVEPTDFAQLIQQTVDLYETSRGRVSRHHECDGSCPCPDRNAGQVWRTCWTTRSSTRSRRGSRIAATRDGSDAYVGPTRASAFTNDSCQNMRTRDMGERADPRAARAGALARPSWKPRRALTVSRAIAGTPVRSASLSVPRTFTE